MSTDDQHAPFECPTCGGMFSVGRVDYTVTKLDGSPGVLDSVEVMLCDTCGDICFTRDQLADVMRRLRELGWVEPKHEQL